MNHLNLSKISNSNSYIIKNIDPISNGNFLISKYLEIANTIPNLSENNRFTIFLEPGIYDLGDKALILNKDCIDIVGLHESDKAEIVSNIGLINNGTILQLVDDVKLINLTLMNLNTTFSFQLFTIPNLYLINKPAYDFHRALVNTVPAAYFYNVPEKNVSKTYIENVTFFTQNPSVMSMRLGINYKGTYKKCDAGEWAFGCFGGADGIFIDCYAESNAFGTSGSSVAGYFENCVSKYGASFGFNANFVAATFKNCTSGPSSFGFEARINRAKLINCKINIDE